MIVVTEGSATVVKTIVRKTYALRIKGTAALNFCQLLDYGYQCRPAVLLSLCKAVFEITQDLTTDTLDVIDVVIYAKVDCTLTVTGESDLQMVHLGHYRALKFEGPVSKTAGKIIEVRKPA